MFYFLVELLERKDVPYLYLLFWSDALSIPVRFPESVKVLPLVLNELFYALFVKSKGAIFHGRTSFSLLRSISFAWRESFFNIFALDWNLVQI